MKRIAIISDSHDDLATLRKAADLIKAENADSIIHLGDFVAPFTLPILKTIGIPLLGVFGNNDGEKYGLKKGLEGWGEIHMPPYKISIEGINLLLSHSPLLINEIKSEYPETNIFLHGHTHKLYDKTEDNIKFINPGEACGYLYGSATMGILELPEKEYYSIKIK